MELIDVFASNLGSTPVNLVEPKIRYGDYVKKEGIDLVSHYLQVKIAKTESHLISAKEQDSVSIIVRFNVAQIQDRFIMN